MTKKVVPLRKGESAPLSGDAILNAMPAPVVVVDGDDVIAYVNLSGEQFFQGSVSHLIGKPLGVFLPSDSPLFSLIKQVRDANSMFTEYGLTLESPRVGRHFMNVQASPCTDAADHVIVSFHERSIADKIDRQLTQRGTARSMMAMAAMLAHEVKNPMSGIRGAAQLLEQTSAEEDRPLTTLIRDEVDRVCDLVDRINVFNDSQHLKREAVNIHKVLTHVVNIAQSGFGKNTRFVNKYDPSLPPVLGNRDQLIQVFLNLVKNAVEAAPEVGGEVVLSTAYRHGVRFAVPGTSSRVHLPLMVSIKDNGEGVPEDMRAHLFDPFVTSKPKGSGLGLPVVAKIVDDHGGVIEMDSHPGCTVFRVMLPMSEGTIAPDTDD